MGIVTTLLSAMGCASGTKTPALADFDAVLYRERALQVDPAAASNGRFDIVAGDKLVLSLHTVRGKSAVAYDKESDWSVVLELPQNPDPAKSMEVKLDGVPAVARVAGEDVLYFAGKARGRIVFARTSDPVSGELEVVFETPERDLIKLGPYRLSGKFEAKTAR